MLNFFSGVSPSLSQTNALPLGKRVPFTNKKVGMPPLPVPMPLQLPVPPPLPLPLPRPVPPGKRASASSFWKNSLTDNMNISGQSEYHSVGINDYFDEDNSDHTDFHGNRSDNDNHDSLDRKDDGYINIFDMNSDHKRDLKDDGFISIYDPNLDNHSSGGNPESDDRYIRGYLQQYGNRDQQNFDSSEGTSFDGNPESTGNDNDYIDIYAGKDDNPGYDNKFVEDQDLNHNSDHDEQNMRNHNRTLGSSSNFHGFCVNPENFSGKEETFSRKQGSYLRIENYGYIFCSSAHCHTKADCQLGLYTINLSKCN
jgi:hypothetical protein